jgi:hypothetical protein
MIRSTHGQASPLATAHPVIKSSAVKAANLFTPLIRFMRRMHTPLRSPPFGIIDARPHEQERGDKRLQQSREDCREGRDHTGLIFDLTSQPTTAVMAAATDAAVVASISRPARLATQIKMATRPPAAPPAPILVSIFLPLTGITSIYALIFYFPGLRRLLFFFFCAAMRRASCSVITPRTFLFVPFFVLFFLARLRSSSVLIGIFENPFYDL